MDAAQQLGGPVSRQTPGCAAGDELAQHDMEPARGLGPQRHQAVVAVDQQADHGGVILAADRAQLAMPQPGDRSRQRIVGVVLAGLGRAQQPDPRRQCRRNIHDVLAGAHQLLRQQLAQPAGRLDRPGPFEAEWCRPGQQPLGLASISHHLQLGDGLFVAVDRDSRMCRLVRVDPDDHRHGSPSSWTRVSVTTGTPDAGAARLFRATP